MANRTLLFLIFFLFRFGFIFRHTDPQRHPISTITQTHRHKASLRLPRYLRRCIHSWVELQSRVRTVQELCMGWSYLVCCLECRSGRIYAVCGGGKNI